MYPSCRSLSPPVTQFILDFHHGLLAALALVACFSGSAAEQARESGDGAALSQEQVSPPSYRVGESWVFRVDDKYFFSYSDPLDGAYEIDVEKGRLEIFHLDGGKKSSVSRPGPLTVMLPTPRITQHPSQFFNFPLGVGNKWQSHYLAGRVWLWVDNDVTGAETVVTPAGTFRAVKIDRRTTFYSFNYDTTWYLTWIYFYSPQSRSIVKYHFQVESSHSMGDLHLEHVQDVELTKFRSAVNAGKQREHTLIPQSSSVAIPSRETEKKTEAPEKVESKSPSALAEAKKAEEIAVPERPALPGKAEGPSPAAAAEFQESALPADAMEEIVLAKESSSPPIAGPIALTINLIGQRKEADGSYIEVLMHEGSVLHSHDNFQVHLETSRYAYVYILLYDSQGKASQLFPDPKIEQPGFVPGLRQIVIPDDDSWFWLDENTGTETVYVLASEKPMADIRGLLARMESVDDAGQKRASQEIKERIAVMQRGVGGITKGQAATYTLSDGKKIQKVTEVVTGTGSVVRAMSFLHR